MNRITLIFLGLFCLTSLYAQTSDFKLDYTPVKNEGRVPKDILTSSSMKYKSKKKKISRKSKNKKRRKSENSFHLQNSFVIDELLHSGRVNFSDPITKYVKKVADELLKNEKSLRKKLKFYTVNSSVPNAFATDRGIIFVNLGLLSKLNTEAELAFILSHEISHYVKKHNLKTKINFDEIQQNKKKLRYTRSRNKYDALLKQSNYSKKLEIEADKLGMTRFLKSDWDINALKGTFDVLEFAHIPFSNTKVEMDFLNLEHLVIPEKYFKKGLNEIVSQTDAIDHDHDDDHELIDEYKEEDRKKYSTHPGLDERRIKASAAIKKANATGSKQFVISEKEFDLAKKRAQFEICNILVQNRDYVAAIYYTYALLKDYPENVYLQRIKTFALYGIAQYVNTYRDEIIPSAREIQGEIQQVFHVFNKLSDQQINLVAARHIWDFQHKYPKDRGMELMLHDMVEDMVIYQIDNPKSFFRSSKLKKKKKDFAKVAFIEIANDKMFKKMLKNGVKYKKQFEEADENPKKKKPYALGLKKVIFLDPAYYKIDNDEMNYLASEKKQKELKKIIKKSSKSAGIKASIIGTRKLSAKSSISDFNDVILLKNWSNELLSHNMYMINSNYNEVQPLIKKYKSKNVVMFGNISTKTKPNILASLIYMRWYLVPPMTPVGIMGFMNAYQGLVYTMVLDLERNEIRMKDFNTYRQKDKPDLVGMNLYWSLLQMKSKKK